MHGSVSVPPSPVMLENTVFRHKLGLSLTRSVLNNSGSSSNVWGGSNTSRCLFGPPDPKQSKDLVREFELKNAINFGKRFNFDIINGEPFPSAKKMKMSHNSPCEDSNEENVNLNKSVDKLEEGDENEGYIWGETYTQDYMAMCNKHAVNASIVAPSRHAKVSLLFAPIIHSNHLFTSSPSKSTASSHSSPKTTTSQSESPSCNTSAIVPTPPSPLDVVSSSSETNNNVIISSIKSHSATSAMEKKQNRINSNSHLFNHHHSHHHHQQQQPYAKKSTLITAHHILTKCKQAVMMKKQRKSIITDYMHVRRMKASSQPNGKKQL